MANNPHAKGGDDEPSYVSDANSHRSHAEESIADPNEINPDFHDVPLSDAEDRNGRVNAPMQYPDIEEEKYNSPEPKRQTFELKQMGTTER